MGSAVARGAVCTHLERLCGVGKTAPNAIGVDCERKLEVGFAQHGSGRGGSHLNGFEESMCQPDHSSSCGRARPAIVMSMITVGSASLRMMTGSERESSASSRTRAASRIGSALELLSVPVAEDAAEDEDDDIGAFVFLAR